MVQARFDTSGQLQPVAFVWRHRTRYVTSLGRIWQTEDDEGRSIRCFLVQTASADTFELQLNLSSLRWQLTRAWVTHHAV